eukprot:Polyplicarium_translucidae@DN3347_c0_g1_i10.p3
MLCLYLVWDIQTNVPMELFVLCEASAGYLLAHVKEWDEIAGETERVLQAVGESSRFLNMVSLRAFHFFKNAAEGLENVNAIASGKATPLLLSFLDLNLPKKKKKFKVGVMDPQLGKDLVGHGLQVMHDKGIIELIRGCHLHIHKLVKQLDRCQLHKFEVSLGHAYSRDKVQFDPNRQDKPIQHAVALVDSFEKNMNTFAMRIKEWYGWHFPELARIVSDNIKFAEVVNLIQIKEEFDFEEKRPELADLVGDEAVAEEIITALQHSMGQEIAPSDMQNISNFATEVIKVSEQRKRLAQYLNERLATVCPNLQALLGDILAARLIAHAGSLSNLAKYPSSTIQILGAEKALFHALKNRTNTPKYGLLFASTFISRAGAKDKGKISRSLANKSSIASRMDAFSAHPTDAFGSMLRAQLEERLSFLAGGTAPRKNIECMRKAIDEYEVAVKAEEKLLRRKRKKEKRVSEVVVPEEEACEVADEEQESPKKKKRKA